jgi:predicted metal-binding protein
VVKSESEKDEPRMTDPADFSRFLRVACDLGAIEAKIIDPRTIVIAPWVRFKCRFGCPYYGLRLCCPPHTPTPEQTQMVVDCYSQALLFHSRGMEVSPGEIAAELEREIFLSGFYKALGFGAGPCRLCPECNLQQCVYPLRARPAMEGCGIDVYATVRANGFPIQVVRDRDQIPNRYGLILIE